MTAEEAKAQAADCAEFDVFTPSTGMRDISTTATDWNLNGTLAEIVSDLMANPGFGPFVSFIQFFHFGETLSSTSGALRFSNGLPEFSGGVADRGDIITLAEGIVGTPFQPPYRVYENADGILALAEEQAAKKCEADLDLTNEFFLTDMWEYTTTAATTHMGYAAPTCAPPEMTLEDSGANAGLACRPTESGDCTGEVFHIDRCVANCPTGFVDVGGTCTMQESCDSATERPNGIAGCRCKIGFNDRDNPGTCVKNTEQEQCDSATEEPDGSLGCQCKTGFNDKENPGTCVAGNVQTSSSPTDGDNDLSRYLIGGGLVLAMFAIATGDASDFAFSPDVGYSLTESGYSVNAGGRMDFAKDNWRLYWTAGQQSVNGDFGDFRYSSGGEYKADFWTAAFSEKVQGKTADYDLSLSANYGNGVWKLSPVYRLHSRFEEEENGGLESETTNSLNLEGVLRYHRWTLRPSAGFQWRNAEDFADNAKFGFSAVRNL